MYTNGNTSQYMGNSIYIVSIIDIIDIHKTVLKNIYIKYYILIYKIYRYFIYHIKYIIYWYINIYMQISIYILNESNNSIPNIIYVYSKNNITV